MFAKLLKYEIKSIGRWYLALYAGIAVLSLVVGFWLSSIINRAQYDYYSSTDSEVILFGGLLVSFGVLVAALLIATFLMVANRFRTSIYGRQGYLTMTLPVDSHSLILSKLLIGTIWYLLSYIMVGISLLIIVSVVLPSTGNNWNELTDGVIQITTDMGYSAPQLILSYFVGTAYSILLVYFAISLGQLFKNARLLLAVVFYFAINFVVGIIQSFLMFFAVQSNGGMYSFLYSNTFAMNSYTYPAIFFKLVLAVAFYFGTHYIMTKKINLQ